MAIGEEFSFEELKQMLCDKEHELGTDELLGLISEFLGDREISEVIDKHIDSLEYTWLYVQRIKAMLKEFDEKYHNIEKEDE